MTHFSYKYVNKYGTIFQILWYTSMIRAGEYL